MVTYALSVDRLPHTLTNVATNNVSITELAAGGLPTAAMQASLNASNNTYLQGCLTTHSGRECVHSHDFTANLNLSEPFPESFIELKSIEDEKCIKKTLKIL
jgi:hypothetical protein